MIAFDNASNGSSTSSATDTFALTVGTGSNRILWVGFIANTTTVAVSSVTYGGVAMTPTSNTPLTSGQRLFLYYLANPASGSNNVVITMASSVGEIHACAASYTGAASGGIPDAVTSAHSTGTSATLTATTVANNAWIVGIFRNDSAGNGSAGTGTTQRTSVSGQLSFDDSGGPFSPAGSHSIQETWTGSANYYALGASMAPYAATPTSGFFLAAAR